MMDTNELMGTHDVLVQLGGNVYGGANLILLI